MKVYEGKSVYSGIAIGRIRLFSKDERQVKCSEQHQSQPVTMI